MVISRRCTLGMLCRALSLQRAPYSQCASFALQRGSAKRVGPCGGRNAVHTILASSTQHRPTGQDHQKELQLIINLPTLHNASASSQTAVYLPRVTWLSSTFLTKFHTQICCSATLIIYAAVRKRFGTIMCLGSAWGVAATDRATPPAEG